LRPFPIQVEWQQPRGTAALGCQAERSSAVCEIQSFEVREPWRVTLGWRGESDGPHVASGGTCQLAECGSFSAPDDVNSIFLEGPVGRENYHFFDYCLGDDYSVKGVGMVRRQVIDSQAVALRD
jgi:hypothetical protein